MRPCGRAVVVLIALAAPAGAASDALLDAVRAHVRSRQAEIVREYAELLAIPNVPAEPEGLRRNAEHVAGMLRRRGLEAVLLDGAGGPPLVYGELDVGAPRTLAVYAHYDGQPVRPEQWSSPPFTPVLRDGPSKDSPALDIAALRGPLGREARLFARSVSDDKAPIVAIAAALDALAAAGARPSVNLKLVFEGEEEAGSPHLAAAFALHRERLRSDAWLVCDGPVHQSGRMQVYFGARGTMGLELTVYGPGRPLHSGHYGNWAPNPAVELVHLVAGLRDRDGRITVAGWSDEVRPLTAEETEALDAVPDADAGLRDELWLARTEAGNARLVERIMLPALNVRGLSSGAVGESAANAIPTEARASFDFRLVPDQRPGALRERLEAHLRAAGYTVVHDAPTPDERRHTPRIVRLEWEMGYPAARTSLGLPFSRALVRAVAAAGDGTVISVPTLGGSVPLHVFAEAFGVPVVGLPIVNHDNAQHAADENLRLSNLWDGIAVFASVFTGLGTSPEWR